MSKRVRWLLYRGVCVTGGYLLAGVGLGLCCYLPPTAAMEPLVFGPPAGGGFRDIVVLRTRFRRSSLRPGDLVWARRSYRGQELDIVRRVAACPGDRWPEDGDGEVVAEGEYILLAMAPNGLDSRHFGPVEASQIKGKTAFVIPLGRLWRSLVR